MAKKLIDQRGQEVQMTPEIARQIEINRAARRNYDVTKDPMASGRVEQSAPEAVLLPFLRLARLAMAGRTAQAGRAAQGLRATAGERTGAVSPNPVISEAQAAAYKPAARPDTWGEAAKDVAAAMATNLATYRRSARYGEFQARRRGLRRNKK